MEWGRRGVAASWRRWRRHRRPYVEPLSGALRGFTGFPEFVVLALSCFVGVLALAFGRQAHVDDGTGAIMTFTVARTILALVMVVPLLALSALNGDTSCYIRAGLLSRGRGRRPSRVGGHRLDCALAIRHSIVGARARIPASSGVCAASGLRRAIYPRTSTGVDRLVVVSLPSWPSSFQPQHFAVPDAITAHECQPPPPMETTPVERPDTVTGVSLCVVVPLPSAPKVLSPQHFAAPDLVAAHV